MSRDVFPEPAEVRRPQSLTELEKVWEEVSEGEAAVTPVAIGAREHVRAERLDPGWIAVETTNCDSIREVDEESGLVTVESGLRWGELRRELRAEGLGVSHYKLYPASATIGGLLGRHRVLEAQHERGDIRQQCMGLRIAGGYTYGTAPRKASGPDLRYLAIGGESREALILTATLSVASPPSARLLEIPARSIETAVEGWRALTEIDVRRGWAWWRRSEGVLRVASTGPERYLKAATRRLGESGLTVTIRGPEAVGQHRSAFESSHPDRRILSRDSEVWQMVASLAELETMLSEETGDDVVVSEWGRQRASAWVSGLEGGPDRQTIEGSLVVRRVSDGWLASRAEERGAASNSQGADND